YPNNNGNFSPGIICLLRTTYLGGRSVVTIYRQGNPRQSADAPDALGETTGEDLGDVQQDDVTQDHSGSRHLHGILRHLPGQGAGARGTADNLGYQWGTGGNGPAIF